MKINPKIKHIIQQLSAILIVFAAVAHFFDTTLAKYTMIVGVAGFIFVTFTTPYPGKSLRGKRMFNIQVFAALLMAVSAYLMFIDYNGWVVVLFIAALQTLYCGIVLPRIYEKEQEEDK